MQAEIAGLTDLAQTDVQKLDVIERYEKFAPVYNQSVTDWGYHCYQTAAELLHQQVAPEQPVLDAGCGTGLVGEALAGLGYQNISGIDISDDMLKQAKETGYYRTLQQQDLSQTPYALTEASFAGITCVGVFSLIADPTLVLQEYCRLLQPGGWLVFTQQEPLYKKNGYAAILSKFEQTGALRCEQISEPVVYLPRREGYADRKVIYCVYQNSP